MPLPKGYRHTEETKKKISLANIGKHRTEETRQKMSIAQKARQSKVRL